MTKDVEALLKQLKDKQDKKYRLKESEGPIVYPIDFFGFQNFFKKRFILQMH